jgi:phosphomannomutase
MVSVSGIRGIFGVDLTPHSIIKYIYAFLKQLNTSGGRILIGRDTRESGKIIEKIIEGTLNALGYDTINIGIAPTPTILFATRNYRCPGGIAITASHNPPQWNALKFCDEKGLFFDEDKIENLKAYVEKIENYSIPWKSFRELGKSTSSKMVRKLHIAEVFKLLDIPLIKKKRFRVAIDPGGGAGSVIDREFLEKLGCEVFGINEKPRGEFPRNPEPLSEYLGDLNKLVISEGAHIGFAQDPDADRLAVVSETGIPVGEEYTIVLAGEAYLRKHKTDIACNLSTSMMFDDLGKRHNARVVRTKIGEIHVTRSMLLNKIQYGGEGNGGVIVPSINPCRDSIVGMGLILELLAKINMPLSEIISKYPSYVLKKVKIETNFKLKTEEIYEKILKNGKLIFPEHSYITLDGIKFYNEQEWLHIRSSNTEPVVRIVAESEFKDRTDELIEIGKKLVEKTF